MAQSVSQITLPGRSLPGGVVSGVIAEHCDFSQWIFFLQDACTSPGNKKTMRCRYCIKSVLSVAVAVLSVAGTVLSVVIVVIVVTALSVARLETSQSRLYTLHTQYPIAVTVLSVAVTVSVYQAVVGSGVPSNVYRHVIVKWGSTLVTCDLWKNAASSDGRRL